MSPHPFTSLTQDPDEAARREQRPQRTIEKTENGRFVVRDPTKALSAWTGDFEACVAYLRAAFEAEPAKRDDAPAFAYPIGASHRRNALESI